MAIGAPFGSHFFVFILIHIAVFPQCYIINLARQSYIIDNLLVRDASKKEWRREDGAHKKVHLQTVEYSVKAIGAGIDAHFFI